MSDKPILLWFRRDLRLSDHRALNQALRTHRPVLPVFIWAPDEENPWAPGAASRWWLHRSLETLSKSLHAAGSRLILRQGPTLKALSDLIEETGATSIYYSRLYEPKIIARDQKVSTTFQQNGIEVRSFSGHLLFEPEGFSNQQGKPFQVFTAFWRAAQKVKWDLSELPPLNKFSPVSRDIKSVSLDEFKLLPKIQWYREFEEAWRPGESAAYSNLKKFLLTAAENYQEGRDNPSLLGTSRLSPYLHWGEISVREAYRTAEIARRKTASRKAKASIETFQRELGWREFAHHLLFHFPHTSDAPLRAVFEKFPWVENREHLELWQKGQTGFPIVDAGMKELWKIGWMHNRVRMITASFLTKDLRISWIEGARWFWDTLVDADLASNTLGWQWAGGCGADAAPYFRIFNPTAQQEKFDTEFKYIRRWIPNFANDRYLSPIVDHKVAREEALKAFNTLKELP